MMSDLTDGRLTSHDIVPLSKELASKSACVLESKDYDASSNFLCEKCAAVTYDGMRVSAGFPDGQQHHDNWRALKEAARLGCRLCRFFTIAALHPKSSPGRAFRLDHNGPIFLKIAETWKQKVMCLHLYVPQDKHPAIYYLYLKKETPRTILSPQCEIGMSEAEHDRLSSTAIEKIHAWIQVCHMEHVSCRKQAEPLLPTRVIDVSPSGLPGHVRLIEGHRLEAEYVALSHCWGDMPPNGIGLLSKCDTGSMDSLRRGVQLHLLPKLYQDAIRLTKAVKKKYIWIDSLCIIQDSRADWANQCEQMSDVYSNSYLTISAMSYENNLQGFQFVRANDVPPNCLLCPLPEHSGSHVYVRSMVDHETRKDYLKSRGWAFQELLLSPRVLHFTSTAMAFECDTSTILERGPGSDSLFGYDKDRKRHVYRAAQSSRTKYYDRWLHLIQSYSQLELTYQTDRLPALSGIACLIASRTNDEYVAGLWKRDIAAGLLWYVWPSQPVVMTYIAPTWSWASTAAIWALDPARRPFLELDIINVQSHLSTSNPYGEVSAASLTISGPLKRCATSQLVKKGQRYFVLKGETPAIVRFALDTGQVKSIKSEHFWCCDCTKNKTEDVAIALTTQRREITFRPHGLVLKRVHEEDSLYQRIGVFEVLSVTNEDTDWHKSGFVKTTIDII